MKNLHLILNEKFTEPFIEFINNNFDSKDHLFLIIGKGIGCKISPRENVKEISGSMKDMRILIKEMYRCKKIFLHGLFFKEIVLILFIQPWLLKKSNWIIWGGDLYWYKYREKCFKLNLYEMIRRIVIRHIGGLITYIKGDYELAQQWYGAKGKCYYSFVYPSNLYREYDLSQDKKDNKKIYILIGNSADPTNNHLEVLRELEKYKNKEIEIICPLSYGDAKYREKVIEEGIRIFEEKFKAIVNFMPYEEYLKLLAQIDIAIFNHERQQAMGNITLLLGMGKKVFLRKDITTIGFFKSLGIQVFDFFDICSFEDLIMGAKKLDLHNIDIIRKAHSQEELKKQLSIIFS